MKNRPDMRYSSAFESGPDVVENDNYPMYSFTTKDIAVQTNQAADLKNEILDKIKANGYDSLSKEEKEKLFRKRSN